MVIDEVFSEKYPADLEPFMTQTTQSSEMLIPPVIFRCPKLSHDELFLIRTEKLRDYAESLVSKRCTKVFCKQHTLGEVLTHIILRFNFPSLFNSVG